MLTDSSPPAPLCVHSPNGHLLRAGGVSSAAPGEGGRGPLSLTHRPGVQWEEPPCARCLCLPPWSPGPSWAVHGESRAPLKRVDLHNPQRRGGTNHLVSPSSNRFGQMLPCLLSPSFQMLPAPVSPGLVISAHCSFF